MTIFGRPKKNVMTEAPQYQPPTPTMAAQVAQHPTPPKPDISPELNDALQELSTKYGGTFSPGDISMIPDLLIAIYAEQRRTNKLLQEALTKDAQP